VSRSTFGRLRSAIEVTLGFSATAILLIAAAPASAATTVFTNPSNVSIGDAPDPATVSGIGVSGLTGPITNVTVGINDYSHDNPDDTGLVVQAPGGQALALMAGAGDFADAMGANITFSDQAGVSLSNGTAPMSGSFKPTSYYALTYSPPIGSAYNSPGPSPVGTSTLASTFNGLAPNGVWSIYVQDFGDNGGAGGFAGGWTLFITTPPETVLNSSKIKKAQRRAKFKFASRETGVTFLCKIDKKAFKSCRSPKTYKNLKAGKRHTFQVKARDAAGNLDPTPIVKKFRI
jgi:hypothetical protein